MLSGPPGVPTAPRHASTVEALDLARLAALATALDALVGAGLTEQARPIAGELRTLIDKARGPCADVLPLARRIRR